MLWTKLQGLEEERERAQILQDRGQTDPDLDCGADSSERDSGRRERAARVVQRQWRKHRDKVQTQSSPKVFTHSEALRPEKFYISPQGFFF